jgi:hypothetical protein
MTSLAAKVDGAKLPVNIVQRESDNLVSAKSKPR